MKKAIIAIAKNENLYLDEWITYYHNLGFSHFYILDNNEPNDLSIFEVSKKYDFVNILDARGRNKLNALGNQKGCYQKTYNMIKDQYDWIGIFDIDEFLYIPKDIDEFLNEDRWKDTAVIHFNWRYYGDNDLVFYDPRPVQERFTIPCPDNVVYNAAVDRENTWVKSMIRGKLDNMIILIHSAFHSTLKCKHSNGTIENGMNERSNIIDFSNGYVKHFGTKTIEEYIKRKCLYRNDAAGNLIIKACTRLDWFFNVNKHTPEKDKIAKFFYDRGL